MIIALQCSAVHSAGSTGPLQEPSRDLGLFTNGCSVARRFAAGQIKPLGFANEVTQISILKQILIICIE